MTDFFRPAMRIEIGQPGAIPIRLDSLDEAGEVALRMSATAKKTKARQDDTCEVTAYGLALSDVAELQRPGALCRVYAGWGGVPTIIATGRVIPSTLMGPRREGGDWITAWSLSDGGADVRDVSVSESWPNAVSASAVLSRVIQRSGLSSGVVQLGQDVRWASGYAAFGSVRSVLTAIAKATGSEWAIQDGAVQVWPRGRDRRASGFVLADDSGLVDVPMLRDDGLWELRSFLLPSIRPGDGVRVDTQEVSGAAEVVDVTHAADSHGGGFFSDLVVRMAR